ncbi:hypothetical protein Q1695_013224 [Nippostrongylus brasiliensis]|nr:hypothetical protein Q1695_013224 [Nippostrongylus brasiliensis]
MKESRSFPATAKETSRRAPPPAAPEKSYSYTMPEVAEGDMKTARGTPVASTPRGRRSSSVRSRQGTFASNIVIAEPKNKERLRRFCTPPCRSVVANGNFRVATGVLSI